jgi:uncharacterized protein (TIGR02118 family)
MVKLIALYKKPSDIEAFDKHYAEVHMPLTSKMPGLKKVEISRITGSPMGASEYHVMAEMYFENMEALKSSMSSPEGRASGKDLMGFAKDVVCMMIAEVEETAPVAALN